MLIGIDWGGTYLKLGLFSEDLKLLKKIIYHSQFISQKEIFIPTLKRLVKELNKKVKGIGIGLPGMVNIKEKKIYYLPNVKGWENFKLGKVLEKELELPIFLDNDANVFALAEARLGSGKGYKDIIFLTLGTGLGGAILFDGRLLYREISALELGHFPIELNGEKCGCGGEGCIETKVGANYLLERYFYLKKEKLKEVKEIYLRAKKGEEEASLIWQEFSFSLGKFLAGLINIFSPQVIILGGGLSGAFSLFKKPLLKVIKNQAMWPQKNNFKLRKAKLKNAGLLGAALLVKENLQKKSL